MTPLQKMLIAEDSDTIRNFFRMILPRWGYDITLAENGQIAYGKWTEARQERQPYRLVISDILMPTSAQGGVKLYRDIRASEGAQEISHVPFLFMSGELGDSKSDLKRILEDDKQHTRFMLKPVETILLKEQIAQLLQASALKHNFLNQKII